MAKIFVWIIVIVIVLGVIAYANPHLWEDVKDKVIFVKTKEYSLKIIKVEVTDFLKVTFEIQNIQSDSISYAINKLVIVTNKGEQHGMAKSTFSLFGVVEVPQDCADAYDLGMGKPNTLFPNAKEEFIFCFKPIEKEDEPVFYISLLTNAEKEQGYDIFDFKIIGDQKEHSFDLTSLIEDNKEISEDIILSEEDFCPKFDNCVGYSEEYKYENDKSLELYIDSCDIGDVIPDGWKIFKLKKWFLNKEGMFTPVNYTRCHKGYNIGENINHYYCDISLSKEIVLDDEGNIIDKHLSKHIGIQYKVQDSDEKGLYFLKLVEYSCT